MANAWRRCGVPLPSGSRVERAMKCPASASLPRVDSVSQPAARGVALHSFVERTKEAGRDVALAEAAPEWQADCEAMDTAWLEGLEHLESELAMAYDVVAEKTRIIGKGIGRAYGELAPTEVVLTLDLCGRQGAEAAVVDLKTGRGHVTPAKDNWQLRVGALAMARHLGLDSARVALLLAPEGSAPAWDIATLDAFDLADAAHQLREMYAAVTKADAAVAEGKAPNVTMGEHCVYCPARLACPAQGALIRRMAMEPEGVANDAKQLVTLEHVALAWERLKLMKQALGDVEAAIRAAASEAPVPLRDGLVLGKHETQRDEVQGEKARQALLEAYGPEVVAVAFESKATKASISRGLRVEYEKRKAAKEKVTVAAVESEAFGLLRDAGAIAKTKRVAVEEFKPEVDEVAA